MRSRVECRIRVTASDPQDGAMWKAFDELMVQIASATEPYWLAAEVGGCVVDAIIDSLPAEYVYLIWASLTDRWERKPDERRDAEAQMRRAATEWLAVRNDAVSRERYFDHWLHDVCGYERQPSPSASRREALLRALCIGLGFCDTGLTPDDLGDAMTASEIADLVLSGEGLDPATTRRTLHDSIRQVIDDWLFDPNGRGANSGLPR